MKKILRTLPGLGLLLGLLTAPPATAQIPTSATFRVGGSTDDAEEDKTTGALDLASSDLELVTDGSRNQWVGLRFRNVTVPAGTVLTRAYLQFTTDEAQSVATNLTIHGQAADDAAAFAATAGSISARPRAAATVAWNAVPAWTTVGQAAADQRSPDIKTVVQEILNRPTWASGNALVLLVDGTGHRTAQSYDLSPANAPQLVLEYTATSLPTSALPVARGSVWRYHDLGTNLGTAWTAPTFNDAAWAFNYAPFGFGDPVATTVSFGSDANNKHPTTYFRHAFAVANAAQFDSLLFEVRRDDGVVAYLNGTEIFRMNMPAGPVTYNTLATSAVDGTDELAYFPARIRANALVAGQNVLAVEVHQSALNSPDLSFDLGVRGKLSALPDAAFPLARSSSWSYYYEASGVPAGNWQSLAFNDRSWEHGPGRLGYGDAPATVLDFGPNAAAKPITAYFRRVVDIANYASLPDTLQLGLVRDDGAAVYVNGTEVLRTNLPTGALTAATLATFDVQGGNELAYTYYRVPKALFVAGRNVVAAEVHQVSAASDDLGFDLELGLPDLALPVANAGCNGPQDRHFGCFTSVEPGQQIPGLILPPTHTFQVLAKEGQPYTNQRVRPNMPGNNDFTCYVPRGTGAAASGLGYLAINHENGPGGVSICDIHFNPTTKLWVVDSTQAVNFYTPDLVTTARNCSGGLTPWGTVVTSEETTNAGDVNADGYQDEGWNVEIDPATRRVKTYANPARREKLWALGRMNHENVAVAADRRTVYEGEDAGTGRLYKFIAATAGDLSSGLLYALRLDQPLSAAGDPTGTTGTWVLVPNTTQAERNTTAALAIALNTTAFNGIEDAEINATDGKVYFTAKGLNRTYRFTDNGATVSNFVTHVGGATYNVNFGRRVAPEAWASGNDNLVFDDRGNCYVQQDGSRNHIWMTRPGHTQAAPQVELFARTPAGSEPTGMTFTPDHKFAFLSFQHPSTANSQSQPDAAGNPVVFNGSTTVVIARREFLGPAAVLATAAPAIRRGTGLTVYPNPAAGQRFTASFYNARKGAPVSVALYDLTGRRVQQMAQGPHERGEFNYAFDGRRLGRALPAGTYVLRLVVDGQAESRKLVLE